jgi:methionyl-tRNA formyltransferase
MTETRGEKIANKRPDKQTKIAFFGTPAFAATILDYLLGFCRTSDFKVAGVVTRPDKPAGRGLKPKPSPVKSLARRHQLPVIDSPKMEAIVKRMRELRPDLIVLAAYLRLLPGELLRLPRFGGLNVHPSLLPKYAGLSPIQHAILAGEEKTGVSVILMDEKYDQGGIIAQKEVAIRPEERRGGLEKRLADVGGRLLIKTIPAWVGGKITPRSQDLDVLKKYYTKKLKREDGFISWGEFLKALKGQAPARAETIGRMIRAFDPWPGVWTKIGGEAVKQEKRLKILEAARAEEKLVVKTVQIEGKRPISWSDFVGGYGQALGV